MNKILLVEDNENTVKRLTQYIKHVAPDLEIIVFPGAGDAYRYAKKVMISVFIVDIQLTDYKGTSLVKQLRALPKYKYTPIIFETALAGEELSAYRDLRCYGFLIKPFDETEFQVVFCDALGLSSQLKDTTKTIQIEQKQFILEYDIQDIVFLEAYGKQVIIHTNSKRLGKKADTISGYTLSGLYAKINDPSFVQCHKSYIVNKNHIERINKTDRQIILQGFDASIPVGSKYQCGLWE